MLNAERKEQAKRVHNAVENKRDIKTQLLKKKTELVRDKPDDGGYFEALQTVHANQTNNLTKWFNTVVFLIVT